MLSFFALFLVILPVSGRAADRPNVIFVIADDLGYGDLGCFGQTKIRTPNLDRLASEGMKFTRHYSGNAVCAPSRCVLMTGKHPGHALVRDNREAKPEGQFPLPAGTETLARRFKNLGYFTGAFGKWGLGGPESTGAPLNQGIDRFFGYNCQRIAHNFYPTYLWDNDKRISLTNEDFSAYAKLKPEDDPHKAETYAKFLGKDYTPDLIGQQALKFVETNRDRPFFLFWPTTVPHLALQVPEDSSKEYVGRWEDPYYDGSRGYLPIQHPRATYAGMITRMDREIGKVMQRVKELGLDEKTIFVFTSDNGPLYDKLGGTDCDFFNSNGGLKGRKGSLNEGGVRVPCIVRWPGKIAAGQVSDRVTGFEDWTPTLLELLGEPAPPGLDGISFAPTLQGKIQPARPFLYREFPSYTGWQAVWAGNYKAVRSKLNPAPRQVNASSKAPQFELYDLADDPTESKNLAAQMPEKVAELAAIAQSQHEPDKTFPIRFLDR
jgi:arylsulfatase A-like enzyme